MVIVTFEPCVQLGIVSLSAMIPHPCPKREGEKKKKERTNRVKNLAGKLEAENKPDTEGEVIQTGGTSRFLIHTLPDYGE